MEIHEHLVKHINIYKTTQDARACARALLAELGAMDPKTTYDAIYAEQGAMEKFYKVLGEELAHNAKHQAVNEKTEFAFTLEGEQ